MLCLSLLELILLLLVLVGRKVKLVLEEMEKILFSAPELLYTWLLLAEVLEVQVVEVHNHLDDPEDVVEVELDLIPMDQEEVELKQRIQAYLQTLEHMVLVEMEELPHLALVVEEVVELVKLATPMETLKVAMEEHIQI